MGLTQDWAELTPDQRRAARLEAWRNPDVEWASSEAEAAYKARVDRVTAAVDLEVPDRVPVNINAGTWPAFHAGITPYDTMHDTARALAAWKEFNLEFQQDLMASPVMYTMPGEALETIGYKLYSWPGHGVAEDAPFQYVEQEWMLDTDYDELIADPSGFMMRTYLPRTVEAFSSFGKVTPFFDFVELPFVAGAMAHWSSEEMQENLERLLAASKRINAWAQEVFPAAAEMVSLGFPRYYGGSSKAPFDILGDTLRGTRGVSFDLFRHPDKVLEACDRLVPIAVDWAMRRPMHHTPFVFMPLHKGADGMMSDEQFRTFYWPSLRGVIIGLIEHGMIPFLFAEGRYGSRLEAIMDLPKGKTVWLFDQTDMARAKETIGQVACIQGNVPLSLMHAGTPQDVERYVRGLIDTAGAGGGYILDIGAVADKGKPENLHAMVRTAKEYGVYA
jgi:hypothetical protein